MPDKIRLPKHCFFFFFLILGASFLDLAMAAEPLEILIEGLEGDVLKNAQASLAVPPGVVREGRADPFLLESFLDQVPEKVRQALQPYGYYEARVTARRDKSETGEDIIRVTVDPGEPVRIAEIRVALRGPGAGERRLLAIAEKFPLREGDPLNQVLYEKTKGDLKAQALELGYLDSDFPLHRIEIHRGKKRAVVDLVLDTGPRYWFGKVTFQGAEIYPQALLGRYLAFQPGEVFSSSQLGRTQLNFLNSDRFQEAAVLAEKEEAEDLSVPVTVRLRPSPPKRLKPGIGYGTDEGIRASLLYQDVNFFRWGHEFVSEMSFSERRRALVSRYIVPSRRDIDSFSSFRLGVQQELVTTYDSWLISLEAERARSFGPGRIGSAYLQFRHEQYTIADQSDTSRLIMPGIRFSQRRSDNPVRPTRGFRYSLETRGAAKFLLSDATFIQQLFDADLVLALPSRFTLLTRVQAGTTAMERFSELPATIRFFAGGDRSVRGYAYRSLGPTDDSGKVVGGRHLLVGSLEIERALGKSWGVAVFYDVGNAFDTFQEMRLAQGAGVGIRYYTPVGPIRVDVARQINVDDPGFRLHITVGLNL